MPKIVLTDVVKRWKDFYATDHVSLDIPDKAFVTLLGPSGCGKTTILRMIAGLETPTSGQIRIGDQIVFDSDAGINIPANKRKVGFLFQNYALWPNMTVYQNISFGLKNVKEEMNSHDYSYKTKKDVIRILQNPKKVIELVNDARDKKGRIIDNRAIIKIIDEFIVSKYTATDIFKLHLEEGGVEEKVESTVTALNSQLEQIANNWKAKDIMVLDDGTLVKIPGYGAGLSDDEINKALDIEKVHDSILASSKNIHSYLNLRDNSAALDAEIAKISESANSLAVKDNIVKALDDFKANLPAFTTERDEILTTIDKVINDLPMLGEDFTKLIASYLRRYVLSVATNDEKTQKVIIKDLHTQIKDFNKQISNQLTPLLDKLPKNIASAKLDSAIDEIKSELSYLPESMVNDIVVVVNKLASEAKAYDKKAEKEAIKRYTEGLSAINVEDREMVLAYLSKVNEAVSTNNISGLLDDLKNALASYPENVKAGVIDDLKAVILTHVGIKANAYKAAFASIDKIAMFLVEDTESKVNPCIDSLKNPAIAFGNDANVLHKDLIDIENIVEGIPERAIHIKSVRGLDKEEIELSLRRVARIVKVEEFMDRYPNELSGGQQQRVAIARTLAPGPKVLFMDEPLSNLDAKLRLEMRSELKRLHVETGATFVYVTHDQLEAMTLATHICLLDNGVLQQYDAPLTVYNKPNNLFVADFVGNPAITLIEVKAYQNSDGSIALNFFKDKNATFIPNEAINLENLRKERDIAAQKKLEHLAVLKKQRSYVEKGNKDVTFNYHILTTDGTLDRKDEKDPQIDDYVIGIRPEYFAISENGNGLPGEVYSAMPSGMETTIRINVDGYILTSVIFGSMDYKMNEKIEIDTRGNNILLFDKVSGDLIASGTLKLN